MQRRNSNCLTAIRATAGLAAMLCLVSCATTFKREEPMPDLDERLEALATYDYGADRTPVASLAAYLTDNSDAGVRRAIESRLAAFVLDENATRAGRQAAVRELGRVGTVRSVPALIELLGSEELGDDAAMALERITDSAVTAKLRNALGVCGEGADSRIVSILGCRRDTEAVSRIAAYLQGPAPDSAVRALGKIATPAAARELATALPNLKGAARAAAWDALLSCHRAALGEGDKQVADEIELELDGAGAPAHVRAAATLASLQNDSPDDLARQASVLLASKNPARQAAGIRLVRAAADEQALLALSRSLSTLPPSSQIALLGLLSDRKPAGAAEAVLGLTSSEEVSVRNAALRALGHLGTAGSVDVLIDAAAEGAEDSRPIARKALRLVTGVGVNERIVAVASAPPTSRRVEALAVIGDRGMRQGLQVLFASATDADADVRAAAIPPLGDLVGTREWKMLVRLVGAVADDRDRQLAITAAVSAGQRMRDPGGVIAVELSRTSALPVRAALLTLAGRLTVAAALPELKRSVSDADAGVRQAAVRALGNWKTPAALAALKAAAANEDEQSRRLAQRGALDVIRNANGMSDSERIKHYREFAPLLTHVDEQRLLLSAVGNLRGSGAVAFAAEFMQRPEVRAEAEAAVIRIAKSSGKPNPVTAAVLQRIVTQSQSQAMQNAAKGLLGGDEQ